MRIELSLTNVIFEGHEYSSKIQWSGIYQVIEKENYFAIYTTRQIANIISKLKLSDEDISNFKIMLSQIKGLKYTPLR